jgi:hypothetical protein
MEYCRYIESKPKHWNPKHTLMVCEIENGKDLKLTLCVQHTMNHQNYGEKSNRRSDLVFELKKIFDKLGIKYHLLPQQVHLTHVNTISNGGMSRQSWYKCIYLECKKKIITMYPHTWRIVNSIWLYRLFSYICFLFLL